jgi:hypothetical protein
VNTSKDHSGAAIVCPFVAAKRLPIIYACRDEPTEPADSGWQFLSKEQVSPGNLKVWSLNEVFDYEPSLCQFMSVPCGTELWRESVSDSWMIRTPADGETWREWQTEDNIGS